MKVIRRLSTILLFLLVVNSQTATSSLGFISFMCEIWYLSWLLLSSPLVHKGFLKSCSKPLQLPLNRLGGARHLWLRIQLSWIWSVLHSIKRGEIFPFDYPKGFPLPYSRSLQQLMLMNSISLVPRSALCSPLNSAQWAQSKHENTLKAEVTGELISRGHHSWPHSRISDEWFFYPNWPSTYSPMWLND